MSDLDSDVVKPDISEIIEILEYKSVNVVENDEKYLSKWISFNLSCIEKDFNKKIKQEDFYNGSNSFFETSIFSHFKGKKYDLVVEEGLEQCPKCSSFKTFSEQIQKRSADEAMTNIYKCLECSWIWEN